MDDEEIMKQWSVTAPLPTYRKIRQRAESMHLSVSKYTALIMEQYLNSGDSLVSSDVDGTELVLKEARAKYLGKEPPKK